MSESVASALQLLDNDATQQTRLFIRMMDKFFDLLNVKGPQIGKLKRKETSLPYKKATDERFKVVILNINTQQHKLQLVKLIVVDGRFSGLS